MIDVINSNIIFNILHKEILYARTKSQYALPYNKLWKTYFFKKLYYFTGMLFFLYAGLVSV